MVKESLSTIEIRILLKCSIKALSKTDISKMFWKKTKQERGTALSTLIKLNLIGEEALPKLGAKKTPVFYNLTKKGKKWVEEYNANYPT